MAVQYTLKLEQENLVWENQIEIFDFIVFWINFEVFFAQDSLLMHVCMDGVCDV